jgi:hypothetical protein
MLKTIEVEETDYNWIAGQAGGLFTPADVIHKVIRNVMGTTVPIAQAPAPTKHEAAPQNPEEPNSQDWIHTLRKNRGQTFAVDTIRFPAGTEFRGKQGSRAVVEHGFLVHDGIRFTSLSAAAQHATKAKSMDGWAFWECRFPGESRWNVAATLRGVRPFKTV